MRADPLAADPEEAAALVGRGDALDDLEHELAEGGDLSGVGLRRQRPLRVAEPRDGLCLELLLATELVRGTAVTEETISSTSADPVDFSRASA